MLKLDRRHLLATGACTAATVVLPQWGLAETSAMLRRAIPHGRGETLPVIGLGTSRVFNVGDDAGKRKPLGDVVAELVQAGGSLVDTASSYGTSEEVVGAVATGTPLRDKIFIATKFGVLVDAHGKPAGTVASPAATICSCDESLLKLGIEVIDLRVSREGLGNYHHLGNMIATCP